MEKILERVRDEFINCIDRINITHDTSSLIKRIYGI